MAFEFVKNVTGLLAQTQDKINRQFLKRIEALEKKAGTDEADIEDLETDVGTLKTTVGDSNSGLVKSVNTINAEIGDAETEGTILYRLAQLEQD